MKRITFFAAVAMLYFTAFAQPGLPQPPSAYDQADEVRTILHLDHKQFEKVYSAYEKYNKAVFGSQNQAMQMPMPPTGGHPGGPMGPPPGHGGRPGTGHPGGHNALQGHPHAMDMNAPSKETIEKNEKKRAKQEAKLVKSMQKLFKNNPEAFAKWQAIRDEQLKKMMPSPPMHGPQGHPQKPIN